MTERLSHKDQDIAPTYQADYVTQDILILPPVTTLDPGSWSSVS